jgi:hypothetical protein
MATQLPRDRRPIEISGELTEHQTKGAAETRAHQECVERERQLTVLELFGTIEFDPSYDYKRARNRR